GARVAVSYDLGGRRCDHPTRRQAGCADCLMPLLIAEGSRSPASAEGSTPFSEPHVVLQWCVDGGCFSRSDDQCGRRTADTAPPGSVHQLPDRAHVHFELAASTEPVRRNYSTPTHPGALKQESIYRRSEAQEGFPVDRRQLVQRLQRASVVRNALLHAPAAAAVDWTWGVIPRLPGCG